MPSASDIMRKLLVWNIVAGLFLLSAIVFLSKNIVVLGPDYLGHGYAVMVIP